MRESIPFIRTVRSGVTETIHRASIVAVKDGQVIFSRGNPNLIVPLRSTAKPFMLTPLLLQAEKAGLAFTQAQICVMASSHNGELIHRNCVQSILELAGCTYSNLNCGSHFPFYEWLYDEFFQCSDSKERQLFHNCSGKHAGMLLLCKLLGIDSAEYWIQEHPIQKLITDSVKEHFDIATNDYFTVGIDGCGVPTYAISIQKLAFAYQNFSSSQSLRQVYDAILDEPYMIAGRERIDTLLINDMRLVAKSGSDGLFCISCPQQRIGIALKIESGNDEAAEAAIVEVLDQLRLLSEEVNEKLDQYRFMRIHTSNGLDSGSYAPIHDD